MEIFVKAKPSSKEEKVLKVDDDHFEVWVKEPPIQGRANAAITRALADYFNTSPSNVLMISGYSSRYKKFEIE